ncbi:C-terminal binding protein [Microbaculum sp. FT89]|uniref:C-terminal binding protein n=1 Tax=Microbaculum sp. FT89 TaxID=3447298 RepID=UPI003F533608
MSEYILHPDAQFPLPADIEAEVYGSAFGVRAYLPADTASIPDDVWAGASGLVCYHEVAVTAAVLDRMSKCRVVVRAGVGFDNIDLQAAGERGIAVCNTPDYGTTDVADHAIALTLAFLRGITFYNRAIEADPLAGWRFDTAPSVRRLSTQTFGVVGLGRIGTATALRAKALGMRVIFFDPYKPTGTELAVGLERCATLDDLLAAADIVSLHTPLTEETRHIMNAATFAKMKPEAILINTGRGPSVDLDALADALLSGHVAAAGLDVLEQEPPSPDSKLVAAWRAPDSPIRDRLVLTPHAAFYSPSSLIDLRRKSAVVALGYLQEGDSRDLVNRDLLDQTAAARRRA